MDDRSLQIYTDGSSKVHHGCDAGCAFVVVYPEHTKITDIEEIDFSYHASKIGAMEIQGINWAIEWIGNNSSRLKDLGISRAVIHCDNQNVVECANKYIYSWMQNSWKKSDGGDIANITAWKRFASLKRKWRGISVEIRWIKGKKAEVTKKVDKLAKGAADKTPRYFTRDFIHPKFADRLDPSLNIKETCHLHYSIIRVYYHQAVNKTKASEYKVYFEAINNKMVKQACVGYCSAEFDQKYIDRKNYYEAKFESVNNRRAVFVSVERIQGKRLELLKGEMKSRYGKC